MFLLWNEEEWEFPCMHLHLFFFLHCSPVGFLLVNTLADCEMVGNDRFDYL